MVDSKKVTSVRVMERLSQVTEDLEDIVKITTGKKPEKSVSGHLIKSSSKGGNAFLDAYRSIVLQDLVFGRKLVTSYLMGREMASAFHVGSLHDLTHALAAKD